MIILEKNSRKALYIQIYEHIRDEIIAGELKEGHRLSATRIQAETLGVSRNTVEQAYMQLAAEGYLDSRQGSGFYVRYIDPSLADMGPSSGRLQSFHRQRAGKQKYRYDMKYGNCCPEDFPLAKWRKALTGAMAGLTDVSGGRTENKLAAYGDFCGEWELRNYLADYLERTRGVFCSPDQIVIGSGNQVLFGFLCSLMEMKRCAVEEPGYDGVRHVLQNQGAEFVPVKVGPLGIDLDQLKKKDIQAVYITPSHQFPLGAVMPIQARMELLKLAEEQDFYVIEDDYDSVFRYEAKAVPSLQGLDKNGRVVYLGGLSKILSPSIRIAYMVLPAVLKNKYDMYFSEYHNTVPTILQDALRLFMEDGSWDRHIRKICLANKRKHDILSTELEKGLGKNFRVLGKGAGLHLIIESFVLTAEEMIVCAQQQGVNLYSMEKYFTLGSNRNLVMAGFGGICLKDMKDVSERLIRAFKIGLEK